MKKYSYFSFGVAFMAVLIVMMIFFNQVDRKKKVGIEPVISNPAVNDSQGKFKAVGERAFGLLVNSQNNEASTTRVGAAIGMGGGIGLGGGDAKMAAPSSIMPPAEMKNYRFVYKGKLELKDEKLEVFRRIRGIKPETVLSDFVGGFNLGATVDLNTFNQAELQNVSLVERNDYGYAVNVQFDDGSVYISQNWETWPAGKCLNDSKCYEDQRVTASDLLADEELFKIANDFLATHSIDRSNFDAPVVNNMWRQSYEATQDKNSYYFPEMIEVIYPLKVAGKKVIDEYSGMEQGLSVSVHLKTRKVGGVYGLTAQNYESSLYDLETDSAKALVYLEHGGVSNYLYSANLPEAKTTEIEVGDPSISYIRYFSYSDGKNSELLVPALAFPIVTEIKNDYNLAGRKAIIVPLPKEILKERLDSLNGVNNGPIPVDTLINPAADAIEPAVRVK